MLLGKEVGLGPGQCVLDGDPAPHSSPSPLSAHAYCGLNGRPSQQLLSSCIYLIWLESFPGAHVVSTALLRVCVYERALAAWLLLYCFVRCGSSEVNVCLEVVVSGCRFVCLLAWS